ncbi:5'-nucleotidase C-terminal domain-containing protein [Aeromicrobium stalagmiti]|uniref:5'-nucleotidase C-terminal domain-containing protein n=1 Tax=Aeromicrobium stalagmiti TaxID=2738988 RepID=UPI001567F07E|nr:5'-nucleotidase C-terminal domain-containing protein [Aeromicrobium stalagmiti]
MSSLSRRLVGVASATLLAAPLLAALPAQAADDVPINLIGINDFHGRVDASTLQWAGTVETLRSQFPSDNSLMVSAGDNISASLFASAIQQDNPTIDILNSIGLDASAAGNHEFDFGYDDLVNRIIPRADYSILAANVRKADNSRALDAYDTFDVAGVKVAVVGAVTQETPTLVSPAGIQGLSFSDPSTAINDAVAELDALPAEDKPDVIVAAYHEGAPDGSLSFTDAMAASAVFQKLVNNTSAEVDAIFMGHTHQKYAYDAPVPGVAGKTRPIIQTGNYGENVGQIVLNVDPDTGEVSSYTKQNLARVATTDANLLTQFPSSNLGQIKQIRDDAVAYANTVGNVQKGEITADITRAFVNGTTEDRASESTMGGLVADALLETVSKQPAGADIGLVNPGGLRPPDLTFAGVPGNDVNTDGVVTYAELNAVLPFANNLNSVKLSGATLKKVLEQQWQRDAQGNVPSRPYLQLGTSKNLTYTYDDSKPEGSRIQSIRINGKEYDPQAQYKVATFSFLAAGGDNFRAFKEGANTDTGLVDRDGWITYFENNSPISPDFARRSVKTAGVKSTYRVGSSVLFTLSKLNLTSTGSPSNTSVSSKLFYTEDGVEKTRSLASKSVTAGTSAPIAFTLPAGASGAMRVESTAFPTGTKVVVPLDVTGASVTAEPVSGTFGDDVDVAVTVTGPEETPSGDVVLKKGDTQVGSGTLTDGAATITVDTEDIGAGANDLTIAYAGDASYPAATGTVKVTVAQAGTTTAAAEPEATKVDVPADVDVTVTSATGTTPTGDVTISDGTDVLGEGELADGTSTVSTDVSGLSIGQHTLTVDYAGDSNHEASISTVDVNVLKGTTPLSASSDGAAYGTSAKVKVEGADGASGLVYVGNGDDVVGVGFLRDGAASITLDKTALKPGSYELDVYYGGSGTFDSAQTTVDLTVTKGATTTKKISVSPTKIVKNRTKPYVEIGVTGAGFTVDGGKVTVRVNSSNVVTGTVEDGKVRVRLGVFTSTGSAKTVSVKYAGSDVALASSTSFTVKVVSK